MITGYVKWGRQPPSRSQAGLLEESMVEQEDEVAGGEARLTRQPSGKGLSDYLKSCCSEWSAEMTWKNIKDLQTLPLIDPCASTLPLEKTKVVDSQTEQEDLQTELSPQVTFFWVAFTSKSRAVMFGPEGSHYDYLKPIYLIFIFIFHHIFILQPIQSTCLVVVCCAVAAAARIRELKTADLLGTKTL